jgi:SH3-like domain-containing protein
LLIPQIVSAKLELPLPRYVSVKSGEANVRKGPGLNYKIKWVLVRKGLPVEIIAEFEQWRKIRDIDGDEGWIHRAMINGKRMVTILDYTRTMYKESNPDSYPVALIEAGANAELLECEEKWCRIESEGQRGWVERDGLWGIYPDEQIN